MSFFDNTRRPEGLGGKLMVSLMNVGHRSLAHWGMQFLPLSPEARVLDCGCGGGANIKKLLKRCPQGVVKGIDYSEVSAEKARKLNEAAIRAGRANPAILDKIAVDYYGVPTPVNQMAGIKTPDAHMLVIEPWDKGVLGAIEHAIMESDLGVTPSNDGSCIRLPFPSLTEERRRELTKQVKKYGEDAKVAVRNIRRDAMDYVKALKKKSEITEDDQKKAEKDLQDLTDKYIKKVDEACAVKEKELMEL